MNQPRVASLVVCVLVASCVTVAPGPSSPAPLNTCSSQAQCAAYGPGGVTPTCIGGICEVPPTLTDRLILVSLSDTAPYAAGSTFTIAYENTLNPSSTCASSCPVNATCVQLPQLATLMPSDLEVNPSAALTANWDLGNPGSNTALPVTVVLRPQVTAGLPLGPIELNEALNTGTNPMPGPGGGPSLDFSIAVPPGVYEQTLMPMSPWDQAFPPDVRIVNLSQTPYPEESVVYSCDPTQPPFDPRCTLFDPIAMGVGATYPTFGPLSRADGGPLDGWVVFLRDQTTLRPISNQVTLSGTSQSGVQLLTSHHPPSMQGAFYNAALVMQPPPESDLPTAIFKAVSGQLAPNETYPQLPNVVPVSGKVVTLSDGVPVPADIVFDVTGSAAGLCRVVQGIPTFDSAANGDLSFTTTVHANDGTFTALLPWGVFRATVRPRDMATEVTIVSDFATANVLPNSEQCQGPTSPGPIVIDVPRTVTGNAMVADGRALASAALEAIPTGCSVASSDASCLPRAGQTITGVNGSYTLRLDPGVYTLRARPADGSALPWVVRPLTVGSATVTPGPDIVVPAPSYASLVLQDFKCNPVVEGLVRMYETPSSGSAYEIGEALTDATGHFDMYLDPSAQ